MEVFQPQAYITSNPSWSSHDLEQTDFVTTDLSKTKERFRESSVETFRNVPSPQSEASSSGSDNCVPRGKRKAEDDLVPARKHHRFSRPVRSPMAAHIGVSFKFGIDKQMAFLTNRNYKAPSTWKKFEFDSSETDDEESEDELILNSSSDSETESRKPPTPTSKSAHIPQPSRVSTTKKSASPRKGKQCACCATTSTPLWRDIGKDLPLCNACGIRWKKYGLICNSCQYVPCKQERDSKHCKRCGSKLVSSVKKAKSVRK